MKKPIPVDFVESVEGRMLGMQVALSAAWFAIFSTMHPLKRRAYLNAAVANSAMLGAHLPPAARKWLETTARTVIEAALREVEAAEAQPGAAPPA